MKILIIDLLVNILFGHIKLLKYIFLKMKVGNIGDTKVESFDMHRKNQNDLMVYVKGYDGVPIQHLEWNIPDNRGNMIIDNDGKLTYGN